MYSLQNSYYEYNGVCIILSVISSAIVEYLLCIVYRIVTMNIMGCVSYSL